MHHVIVLDKEDVSGTINMMHLVLLLHVKTWEQSNTLYCFSLLLTSPLVFINSFSGICDLKDSV